MKKFASWKTGLAGVLSILPQLLVLIFPNIITHDVANTISGLMVSLGLIAAKDSNVTGGTKSFDSSDRPPTPPKKP